MPRPERPSIAKLVCLLLFKPEEFTCVSERHAEQLSEYHQETREERLSPDRSFPPEQTRIIRNALAHSGLLVAAVVVAGAASGFTLHWLLGPAGPWQARIPLYLGIGILLWATLGRGGWSIQTIKGESLPELVDEYLFRVLHLLGSFFLVLSASWQAASTFS